MWCPQTRQNRDGFDVIAILHNLVDISASVYGSCTTATMTILCYYPLLTGNLAERQRSRPQAPAPVHPARRRGRNLHQHSRSPLDSLQEAERAVSTVHRDRRRDGPLLRLRRDGFLPQPGHGRWVLLAGQPVRAGRGYDFLGPLGPADTLRTEGETVEWLFAMEAAVLVHAADLSAGVPVGPVVFY
jgi:hypothetical protein